MISNNLSRICNDISIPIFKYSDYLNASDKLKIIPHNQHIDNELQIYIPHKWNAARNFTFSKFTNIKEINIEINNIILWKTVIDYKLDTIICPLWTNFNPLFLYGLLLCDIIINIIPHNNNFSCNLYYEWIYPIEYNDIERLSLINTSWDQYDDMIILYEKGLIKIINNIEYINSITMKLGIDNIKINNTNNINKLDTIITVYHNDILKIMKDPDLVHTYNNYWPPNEIAIPTDIPSKDIIVDTKWVSDFKQLILEKYPDVKLSNGIINNCDKQTYEDVYTYYAKKALNAIERIKLYKEQNIWPIEEYITEPDQEMILCINIREREARKRMKYSLYKL